MWCKRIWALADARKSDEIADPLFQVFGSSRSAPQDHFALLDACGAHDLRSRPNDSTREALTRTSSESSSHTHRRGAPPLALCDSPDRVVLGHIGTRQRSNEPILGDMRGPSQDTQAAPEEPQRSSAPLGRTVVHGLIHTPERSDMRDTPERSDMRGPQGTQDAPAEP